MKTSPKSQSETSSAKAVGIWIRVSTEDQAQGESPAHHEKRAQLYAEAKEWKVIEIYHLEGVSGKSVMDHPETRRMLKDIQSQRISGLIFSKLARLGRNTRELLDFSDFFQKHTADLISLQEAIDTSTPAGRLFYTVMAGMAHWEREEIASRVSASVPIRAKLGKSLGGLAPFGYDWKDKELVPNPAEAPIRKFIHELFAEHGRRKTVARILTEKGYRNRKGKPFTASGLRFMLADPTPKGLHRANYMRNTGSGNRWGRKPESDWVYQPVEPILSTELWDRSFEIFQQQQTKNRRPAKRTVHLFAGLTWCVGGQKMYVPSNTPKYVCQKCRNKIPAEDLEEILLEQVKGYFLSPEAIGTYLLNADETIQSKTGLASRLEQEQKTLRGEMDKTFKLYLSDQLSQDAFALHYRPIEARLVQLDEELVRLQAELGYLKVNLMSRDEILHQAHGLYDRWPSLSHEEKRTVIEAITERITIGIDEVSLDLYYLGSRSNPDLLKSDSKPSDDDDHHLTFAVPRSSFPNLMIPNISEISKITANGRTPPPVVARSRTAISAPTAEGGCATFNSGGNPCSLFYSSIGDADDYLRTNHSPARRRGHPGSGGWRGPRAARMGRGPAHPHARVPRLGAGHDRLRVWLSGILG